MSLDGSRIPAWRRLGLALKNEDQSGVAVPEAQASHSEPPPVATYETQKESHDYVVPPVDPALNGKSPKLGKRKHQPEPAEDGDHNSKRSKNTAADDESNGATDYEIPAITHTDPVDVDAASSVQPATENVQPKGDPNYRKKKPKPPKRRREDRPAPQSATRTVKISQEDHSYPALLASTETDHVTLAQDSTSKHHAKQFSHKEASDSPSQRDRRKSVAFTPDTKTSDGNSGQELFKKWVAEQKGTGDVSAPPAVSNFTLHSLIAEEEKAARKNGQLDAKPSNSTATQSESTHVPITDAPQPTVKAPSTTAAPSSTVKGKKKDPSVYLAYLDQYYSDRDHWKFNKAKQNDVVDNALNIFRIPSEHSDALLEYVAGLKGAGVIERLSERCYLTIKELDEQDSQNPMDDGEVRKAAEDEAEQERIAAERKRRKTEGDVEGLVGHPHSDGYIRRLRRKRAEALLTALGRAAPILPVPIQKSGVDPLAKTSAAPQRDARKRKRRSEISSDESSSDSSDDDSSSDSDSDSEVSSSNASNPDSSSDSESAASGDESGSDSD